MATPTQDRVRAQFAGPLFLSLVYSVFSLTYGGETEGWVHYVQTLVFAAAWLNARFLPVPGSLHSAAAMLPIGLVLNAFALTESRGKFACGLLTLSCAYVFSLIDYFLRHGTTVKTE